MRKRKFAAAQFIRVLCLVLAAFCLMPSFSGFASPADTAQTGSIAITFRHEKTPVEGATFRIYRVADVKTNGSITLTAAFRKYPVSVEKLDRDAMNLLASTLAAYAARDSISPDGEGTTGKYGGLRFASLQKGLYLVVGDPIQVEETVYTPQTFFVSIPTENTAGETVWDVAVEPKYDLDDAQKPVEREVLKIWLDDGDSAKERPSAIVVQLLQNGKVYSEVTLNEQNNWRHTWSELDPTMSWAIVEKSVPENYTVTVNREGVTFTVRNTYTPPPPPPPPKLPQSGLVWWPVPLLIGGGLLVVLAGVVLLRKKPKEK